MEREMEWKRVYCVIEERVEIPFKGRKFYKYNKLEY